jgi:hypothetical protein
MDGPKLSLTTSKSSKKKPPERRGRPPIQGEAMKRFQVVLDTETAEGMKSLDDGNLSGGIRKAWKKLKKS